MAPIDVRPIIPNPDNKGSADSIILASPMANAIFKGMFTGPVVALAESIAIEGYGSGAKNANIITKIRSGAIIFTYGTLDIILNNPIAIPKPNPAATPCNNAL